MSSGTVGCVVCCTIFVTFREKTKKKTLLAALKKAQSQVQERLVSERIASTKSFLLRSQKRVEQARQVAVKAREALAEAIASQEKEGLLEEGERRLELLLTEDQATPSLFTAPSPPALAVSAEASRLQALVDNLQKEIAQLRGGPTSHSDGRRRFRRGRGVPTQETQGQHRDSVGHHGKAATDASTHHRRPRTGVVVVEMNNPSARYGLRAVKVGEASHPGPPVRRMRRLVLRNGSPRSPTRVTQVDSETDDDMPLVRRSANAFTGLEVEPGGAPEVYPMSDDADVEVAPKVVGLPEARMARRVVLVPPRSIQDRTAVSSGSRFEVLESEDEAITVAVGGGEDVPARDHTVLAVGVPEIPENVMDEAPSEDEVDGASSVSGVDLSDVAEEALEMDRFPPAGVRVGLASLDIVNVEALFRRGCCLMQNVPKFLVGPFRSVLQLVLQEIQATDWGRCKKGWKLFLLAARMLLFRHPRGGSISR